MAKPLFLLKEDTAGSDFEGLVLILGFCTASVWGQVLLVDFVLLKPFDFALTPVFVHCAAALAVTVVKPEARKTVMTMHERALKLFSFHWLYVTRVISTIVISGYVKLNKL